MKWSESKPRDGNFPPVGRGLWTSWNSSSKIPLIPRCAVFHFPRPDSTTCCCLFVCFCILAGMRDGSPTRDPTQGSAVQVPNPNHEATRELPPRSNSKTPTHLHRLGIVSSLLTLDILEYLGQQVAVGWGWKYLRRTGCSVSELTSS